MVVNKTCPQHFTKDKSTWIIEGVAKHFSNWEALGNNENKKGLGAYCIPGTEPLVGIPYDINTILLISEGCYNK